MYNNVTYDYIKSQEEPVKVCCEMDYINSDDLYFSPDDNITKLTTPEIHTALIPSTVEIIQNGHVLLKIRRIIDFETMQWQYLYNESNLPCLLRFNSLSIPEQLYLNAGGLLIWNKNKTELRKPDSENKCWYNILSDDNWFC